MSNTVIFELNDRIATITLNRPEKLNTVTPEMAQALTAHVHEVNARSDVLALVLTGTGDKAFCAGSDIAELDTYDSPWEFRNRADYCDAIRALRKPVICATS